MNLVALALGVFMIGMAAYTASDPLTRARTWVSVEQIERAPERAKEKQRRRARLFAYVCGCMGLLFVLFGLTL